MDMLNIRPGYFYPCTKMHVSTFLLALGVLVFPTFLASSPNDFRLIGSKRPHDHFEIGENDDIMPFFNLDENSNDDMMLLENLTFPSDIFASGESKVAEIIAEYSKSSNDTVALNKLMDYSKNFPEEVVYQILSMGEIRLMTMRFYYDPYISDEKIGQALRNLFQNISCKHTLLNIIRIHINLVLNDPDLITPKSVLIGFKNYSFDLFNICAEKERTSGKVTINYSKYYQLFLKIFKEINLVHLSSPRDFYNFNKILINYIPDFLANINHIDIYRIALNFVYWDEVDELNQIVSHSIDIVVFIPQKCSSLLHFATEFESIKCLDFLLDLVHEIAILEPETGGISPFVYALILKNKAVLDIYAKHEFNNETIVTIESKPISAAQLIEQTKNPSNLEYFQYLIKK